MTEAANVKPILTTRDNKHEILRRVLHNNSLIGCIADAAKNLISIKQPKTSCYAGVYGAQCGFLKDAGRYLF
jgi:hypothetical protein